MQDPSFEDRDSNAWSYSNINAAVSVTSGGGYNSNDYLSVESNDGETTYTPIAGFASQSFNFVTDTTIDMSGYIKGVQLNGPGGAWLYFIMDYECYGLSNQQRIYNDQWTQFSYSGISLAAGTHHVGIVIQSDNAAGGNTIAFDAASVVIECPS